MQNRHSWESGSQPELEEVFRCEVASRSLIDAGSRIYARVGEVGKDRASAAAWSLQTVYDLPAIDIRTSGQTLSSAESAYG